MLTPSGPESNKDIILNLLRTRQVWASLSQIHQIDDDSEFFKIIVEVLRTITARYTADAQDSSLAQILWERLGTELAVDYEIFLGLSTDTNYRLQAMLSFVKTHILDALELLSSTLNSTNAEMYIVDYSLDRDFLKGLGRLVYSFGLKRGLRFPDTNFYELEIAGRLRPLLADGDITEITLMGIAVLSPMALKNIVAPYLVTIQEIAFLLDDIRQLPRGNAQIRLITQHSPVRVIIEGVGSAIQWIEEKMIPWKRAIARRRAEIKLQTDELTLQKAEHSVLEAKHNLELLEMDSELKEQEIIARQLQNELLRKNLIEKEIEVNRLLFDLEKERLGEYLKHVRSFNKELSDDETFLYALKLARLSESLEDTPLDVSNIIRKQNR